MDRRKMLLPEGWYPHNKELAEKQINSWKSVFHDEKAHFISGFGPHAGWAYSGELANTLVQCIPEETELLIIAGGHLTSTSQPRLLNYSSFETPFGSLSLSSEAAQGLCSYFTDDHEIDNTVEIYLPLIKYLRPNLKILPVRLAPNLSASLWGGECYNYCRKNKINAFFLGSTDLSHYGSRFAYTDYGTGQSAREKIKRLDRDFLDTLKSMNEKSALKSVSTHQTACSAGAALGACGFAQAAGISCGSIIDQRYSYDMYDSGDVDFVGYGSIVYS
ncbi:AmmeMemoRadiSam system protein B [Oceanispirochaeta sp.]|jgi:AmmeMemoRadiSam system protein B|uniref:AmmeMemoRadiSam system protein B n=1 Tax=Oceanispirochaeta sp. TaxID=2035350 RepID=UPI0026142E95|nr:AmmeMemoRadiSam system protein B [Oceanispirochaeta sp.]MDA3958101.1 AmmeMemoRadiSam system protein B [Oceanispirochaeta sp.]